MSSGDSTSYRVAWHDQIADVDSRAWNRLARPLATPFLEWEWLHNLEASGSIAPPNGWLPQHLTVWQGDRLVAAAPLYIKSHSEGEFVFDHPWAEVAYRQGLPYYPKLVGMTPVTPVPGYRFLMEADQPAPELTRRMLATIANRAERLNLAGCSFLFVDPDWAALPQAAGYYPWKHSGYLWRNAGYTDFDAFLARFKSGQRRNIRRERERLRSSGITVEALAGDHLPLAYLDQMYRFYSHTNDQFGPWGCRYLTEAFFRQLHNGLRHRLLFTVARRESDRDLPVAMAMLVHKGESLFGRYWGTRNELPFLHFETCYYRPLEWAIAQGIQTFDPGLGGAHKARRGFEAHASVSLHRFFAPRMQQILAANIERINRLEQQQIDAVNQDLPFRRRTH